MHKNFYCLVIASLLPVLITTAFPVDCDTSIQPIFLPGLETNTPVLALDHVHYNNTVHIIGVELWRAVHLWQNTNNTWHLSESLPTGVSGSVVMKLLPLENPDKSLLVVGGSQTGLTNGLITVWERDKESWSFNSEIVLPYEVVVMYTDAFISGNSQNSTQDITPDITLVTQGFKGDGLQFFMQNQNTTEWEQTSLIVNDAPTVTFTNADNNLFLTSIEAKGENPHDLHYFINIWQQDAQSWKFVDQISIDLHYACEVVYTLIDDKPTLIAGTLAGMLVMWQQDKQGRWVLVEEIQAHTERVTGLEVIEYLHEKYLVSGSWDGTLKIWQNTQGLWELVKTLCTKEFSGGRVESLDSFIDENSQFIITAGCAQGQVTCTAVWGFNATEIIKS